MKLTRKAERRSPARRPVGRTAVCVAGLMTSCLGAAAFAGTPARAAGLTTEMVSVNTAGQYASGGISRFPSLSQTGLIVAFDSKATNLVTGDTNGFTDVFVRYRALPQTIRASVAGAGAGAQADGASGRPSMDDHAQQVAFESTATNLVPGDTNGLQDIFARNLPSATTQRVSVAAGGGQANGSSASAATSGDARYVAFTSQASNLVPGDTNGVGDVFVRDLVAGTTTRVSVSGTGEQGNGLSSNASISGGGRQVAFVSTASNLVPGDTNGTADVFVRDLVAGTTKRVSVASGGGQANGRSSNPSISGGGQYVAFSSEATNLVAGDTNSRTDVFVHHSVVSATTRISVATGGGEANGSSFDPAISDDARYVAFGSDATNLVPGDTNLISDIFRHDRNTGETERWSLAHDGSQASTGTSTGQPAITNSGSRIAFVSNAANLVPRDTVLSQDVFMRRP